MLEHFVAGAVSKVLWRFRPSLEAQLRELMLGPGDMDGVWELHAVHHVCPLPLDRRAYLGDTTS